MTGNSVIELNGVSKLYKGKAGILNCNLKIPEGQITAFIGKNGAGKTTTIKLIMGFLKPSSGKITVFGKEKNWLNPCKDIGYLPEIFSFPPLYTIHELFSSLAGMRKISYKTIKEDIDVLIELFELKEHLKKNIGAMSKGTKQKVGIIQTLLHKPKLIIFDEPTTGLDPLARNRFFKVIKEYCLKERASIIFSSHELKELSDQANYYSFFHQNEIIDSIPAEEILQTEEKTKIFTDKDIDEEIYRNLPEKEKIIVEKNKIIFPKDNDNTFLNQIISILIGSGVNIKDIQNKNSLTVEEYYFNLLKKKGAM
ncbi:ABC transporter ATP-binding protein [Anaerobranca gottschalkii]|uniref:ABC-2 type transport system ATP-binding protein n=1 Tax=Anaerobranca gottschalkii DSM 13577 TaxID=1120990 RepID=A0A1H9YNJ9_9FIRM|nr:ABC transporter ATP-binding protein [Anaerobranca gottschalkii]SES70645.1 ABC-2 type transport system ATP-binding protein [Anaerobranca gottschalkii DSM 13577]